MENTPFTGTKKFGSGDGWNYIVNIQGDEITLKQYPDETNNIHTDRSKPHKVIKGFTKGDDIIVSESHFKFESGILYEANNEGGWNDYPEIKTATITINNSEIKIMESFQITCNKCGSKGCEVVMISKWGKKKITSLNLVCKDCGQGDGVIQTEVNNY